MWRNSRRVELKIDTNGMWKSAESADLGSGLKSFIAKCEKWRLKELPTAPIPIECPFGRSFVRSTPLPDVIEPRMSYCAIRLLIVA